MSPKALHAPDLSAYDTGSGKISDTTTVQKPQCTAFLHAGVSRRQGQLLGN